MLLHRLWWCRWRCVCLHGLRSVCSWLHSRCALVLGNWLRRPLVAVLLSLLSARCPGAVMLPCLALVQEPVALLGRLRVVLAQALPGELVQLAGPLALLGRAVTLRVLSRLRPGGPSCGLAVQLLQALQRTLVHAAGPPGERLLLLGLRRLLSGPARLRGALLWLLWRDSTPASVAGS